MKDFLKQELSVGDSVILIAPGYRTLVKAVVVAFTPENVRVEYTNNWNYRDGLLQQKLQHPSQLVKVV